MSQYIPIKGDRGSGLGSSPCNRKVAGSSPGLDSLGHCPRARHFTYRWWSEGPVVPVSGSLASVSAPEGGCGYSVAAITISQHALAVVVEVNEGARSVQLPCLYSGFIPDNSTLMWTRSDMDPKSVHQRQKGGDDVRGQNQRYSRRTSMTRHAFITKDFSLTLRKPTKTDNGNYTCSISAGGKERRLRDIQLQVKDEQKMVTVREGSKSVILPCSTKPNLSEDTTVEWTCSDLGLITVDSYPNRDDDAMTQDDLYTNRTKMNKDLLRTGDLSLTLKTPTERDSGGYICTIHKDKDTLRQKVVLHVKGYQKVVDSGVEFVQLPCKTVNFLKDAKVEWEDRDKRKVYVYQNDSDQLGAQDEFYRDRTKMKRNLLDPGDFSLTLNNPTEGDTNTYTCTVYSKEGNMLRKKQVELKVRVPQVEVNSGEKSVQLIMKTKVYLPDDAKVEWMDRNMLKVHVYQKGSDRYEEQDLHYRDRTQLKKDLLKTGDLSLTLKYPTDWDRGIYTCTVYRGEENILKKKQVELKVRVPQVGADSGVESVQLPCRVIIDLPRDGKVEWKDGSYRTVHVYENGSDQPKEQDHRYSGRTKMNEDLLETGDLSLTLKHPTGWDNHTYTFCQVEVEEGAESVHLPFKTTENLPEDTKVVWWDTDDRKVHVYENGSDQPEEQHQVYRDRTKMNEDLLKTGDLSLTLKHPTVRDSGRYCCKVYGKMNRYKAVVVKVKGRVQVQDQTGDIRNRSSSIDPTPLMADQSV
ncbi:butyrophilin [Sarotherodon galilaeus]